MLHRIAPNGSGVESGRKGILSYGPAAPLVFMIMIVAAVLGSAAVVSGCGSAQTSSPTVTVTNSVTSESTLPITTTSAAAATTVTSEPVTTVSSTTTSSSTTTTTEALSTAETRLPNGHIRALGYIDKVWEVGGVRYISIDYVEMLTGEEAKAAAIEAGEIAPGEDLPNDYFIRNTNPQKREFSVSTSASITTATFGGGSTDKPVTWAQFKSFWSDSPPTGGEHLHEVPWWIERAGHVVVGIAEQYLP